MLCDTGASRTIAVSLIRAVLSRGHKLCGKYRRARGRESRALRVLLLLPAVTATSGTSSYFPLMRKRPPAVWDGAAPKFNTSGEQRLRSLFSTCVTVSSRTVGSSPEHQQVVSRSGLVVRRRYLVHSDVAEDVCTSPLRLWSGHSGGFRDEPARWVSEQRRTSQRKWSSVFVAGQPTDLNDAVLGLSRQTGKRVNEEYHKRVMRKYTLTQITS